MYGQVPVEIGDELDVKIEAVGEKGDGIARKEGFVLFVPNTKEGDMVRIKVTKVLKRVGFAEVLGKSEAAPQKEEQPAPKREPAPEDSEDFGDEQTDHAEETSEDWGMEEEESK